MLMAVFDRPGRMHVEERPRPGRGADEALAHGKRAGVCEANLHFFTGKPPSPRHLPVMEDGLSGIAEQSPRGTRLMPDVPCGGSDVYPGITAGLMATGQHAGARQFLSPQIGAAR